MLENKCIISFSITPWNKFCNNRHQILFRLAKKNKVVWIYPPFYIRDLFKRSKKTVDTKSGLHQVRKNLYIYKFPKLLPMNYKFTWVEKILDELRFIFLNRNLKKLRSCCDNTILWIWEPYFVNAIGKCRADIVCYYIYDEYSLFESAEVTRNKIRIMEKKILRRADIVFAVSKTLQNNKKHVRGDIYVVPNGVDFEVFSRAREQNAKIPSDLCNVPRPRIGYVGAIKGGYIDFELLNYLAEKRKNWSIVLIGPEVYLNREGSMKYVKRLKARSNVYFLGWKNVDQLPYYVNGLDVCLICYKLDEEKSKNKPQYYCSPLKLFEYFALGKPVVSVNIPAIREFRHLLRIATSKEQWIQAIEESLKKTDLSLVEKRIEVARRNSWDHKVELISEIIQRKLVK